MEPTMTGTWTAADGRDFYAERAAILEFDAGLDRLEAEARAMAELIAALRLTATNRTRTATRRDPDAYRAYQAEYMRKRRATRQARVAHA
jgi:hypothetical protein